MSASDRRLGLAMLAVFPAAWLLDKIARVFNRRYREVSRGR